MRYALTLFSLMFVIPCAAETVPKTPELLATVATRSDLSMRMTVPVTIEGRGPFQFVVDTGSAAPPKAAHALAIMHAAIYDAVNGITQTHEPYFVRNKAADQASPEAAASVAARLVLLRTFPAQQAAFDATYNKVMRAIPQGEGKRASIDWGEHVAQTLLADRAKDGSQATVIYASRNTIGVWRPTEPAFAKPALPQQQGQTPPVAQHAAGTPIPVTPHIRDWASI